MSKINDLIKELCPNGVQYKNYGDVFEIKTGKGITTKDASNDGLYPIISGGTTPMGYYNQYNRNENTVTVSRVGANAGFVSFIKEKFYLNDKCFSIVPVTNYVNRLLPKFVFHYTKNIEKDIMKLQSEGGVPTINTQKVSNLLIPIPPIEVQEEIVRILDKFGELEEELEAELEARRSQYEFWCGKLLNKKRNIKISEYFTRLKGTPITAGKMKEIEVENGEVRIFAGGQTKVDTSKDYIPKEDIINVPSVVIQSRGLINFIYYDRPFSFKNEMWAYTCENPITVKYLYYYLKNNVDYFRMIGGQMGSMPQISLSVTENFDIFLPSIEEQEKIVNILDKFEKMVNILEEGLPAEIELRKKQYEYYRNKLLDFRSLKGEI